MQGESRWEVHGDPTEGALLAIAGKVDFAGKRANNQLPRLDTIPFESQHQYMVTLHDAGPGECRQIYAKGGVEVVLSKCTRALSQSGDDVPLDTDAIQRQVEAMAAKGLRVLAFAGRQFTPTTDNIAHADISELVFFGLQGMIDPPRPEVVAAIKVCQAAGVRVKMITGDHAMTARAIAQQLGLDRDDPKRTAPTRRQNGS